MTEQPSQPQGFLNWLKESVTVKLAFIGFLILVLLIPSALINDLVNERAARQEQTVREVSDQYSGSQLIQGPVLLIPYKAMEKQTDNSGKEINKEVIKNLFIL